MATLVEMRQQIEALLEEYANIPAINGEGVGYQTIFDQERDHYLLVAVGWQAGKRVHDVVIHFDILEGKVWLQVNNTDQPLTEELVAGGIPRASIVLGFQPPELRPYTDYAST